MKTKNYFYLILIFFSCKTYAGNELPAAADKNWFATAMKQLQKFVPPSVSPDWRTSANGILQDILINPALQVQSVYGYTVAGLGDVNGDGYDDVAIGAPTMADVVSGTGSLTSVGAVFIYLGSNTGLKTEPDKVLQPTTALNGAMFGFSIDAGDITGDGINDIVIGAPLDSYTTTASGIFPTTVNVRAGKVYVYNSEALFGSANPSPFLELHLQGTPYFSAGLLTSNINLNALFGFSVAVTKSLNPLVDSKSDIIIGCPGFVGVDLLSVQNGAAFIYYSNNLNTTAPAKLDPPDMSLLGIPGLPLLNTKGLLFGYSVDGAGDYDHNGMPDIVVGAPAGIDLSSLSGIFTGQALGGSAYVFYGNGTAISTASTAKLQATASGLLSNAANLFGYKVKGATDGFGNKTGNILIGAPTGDVVSSIASLTVKAGQVHVFKQHAINAAAAGTFISDQVLSSPRYSSLLALLSGQSFNLSLLYGASIDNMLDVNCDNIGDIIVGEPLSTSLQLLGADVAGGAAYVYLGNADGTYNPAPYWDLHDDVSPLLGINTTPLTGWSVAGARYIKGHTTGVRSVVGGPGNALDFGSGLLQLNNTVSTLVNFAIDNNGFGKASSYGFNSCSTVLPVTLLEFKGQSLGQQVLLIWKSSAEINFDKYELQRSSDGINYNTIARVMAKGETLNNYDYTDIQPINGINYYRLKMVDTDGNFKYSSVVIIRIEDRTTFKMTVSPNPAQQNFHLELTGFAKGIYKMELLNAAGQIFITRPVLIMQSIQTVEIQRQAAMVPGIYWIRISDYNSKKIKSSSVLLQ